MRGDEIFSCSVVRTYKLNVESVCNVTERISVSLCIIGKKNAGDASDSNLSQYRYDSYRVFSRCFSRYFAEYWIASMDRFLFFLQITTILPSFPFLEHL